MVFNVSEQNSLKFAALACLVSTLALCTTVLEPNLETEKEHTFKKGANVIS